MYFGAHVKASGGVWTAVERGEALGVEAIQFFAGSPRTWKPQIYRDARRGALPRGARRLDAALRGHPHHLSDQPGDGERGVLREVGGRPGRRGHGRRAARRRSDRHPHRLPPGRRLRGRSRARARGPAARPRRGRRLAGAGAARKHRRGGRHHGRHGRRAGRHDRLGRRRRAPRRVPRHRPPARRRATSCAPPTGLDATVSPRSTRRSASSGSSWCT